MPQFKNRLADLAKEDAFIRNGEVNLTKYSFNDTDEIEELDLWLQDKKNLTTLKLIGCSLCEQGSVRSMFVDDIYGQEGPVIPRTLQGLDLKLKKYSKSQAIAELLTKHTTWLEINLSQNNLAQRETNVLLKAIAKEQKRLRHLDLGFNAIGDEAIDEVYSLLRSTEKCSLKSLILRRTSLSKKQLEKIIKVLKENKTLRVLDLRENYFFDDEMLKLLLETLQQNSILVDIKLPSGLDKNLLELLSAKLKDNIETRKKLHARLLSKEHRLKQQAFSATKSDDVYWLNVLIGLEKSSDSEFEDFQREKQKLFFDLRKLSFFCSILFDQVKFLESLESKDLIEEKISGINSSLKDIIKINSQVLPDLLNSEDEQPKIFVDYNKLNHFCSVLIAQVKFLETASEDLSREKLNRINLHLKEILEKNTKLEISIYNEFLDMVKEEYENGALFDDNYRQEKINEFTSQVIDPCLKVLPIELNSATDLKLLINTLEERVNKAYRDVEYAKKAYDKVLMSHNNFVERHCELLESVKSLDLDHELAQEREEIEEKLIETHIDPNSKNLEGDTLLLSAFRDNRHGCVKVLLDNGAEILERNNKGESVFSLLLNGKNKTRSGQIVIHFIQKKVDKIWFEIVGHKHFEDEFQKLQDIKKVLDKYLNVLLGNEEMPLIMQFFTGVYNHIDERKKELEQYYQKLMRASRQSEINPLAKILTEMLDLSMNAKRGVRDSSSLHEAVSEKVIPLLEQVTTSYYELKTQLELLQNKQEQESAAQPKINEIEDELVKDFTVINRTPLKSQVNPYNSLEMRFRFWWKKLCEPRNTDNKNDFKFRLRSSLSSEIENENRLEEMSEARKSFS